MKKTSVDSELSEDMEVVGPGPILADARKVIGLSQQDVAARLNFRLSLVQNIEAEIFDKTISATYNRGYLKSYAKLVNVSIEEVISSYEMLGVAELQYAEMQSFSRITEKRAQNSMLNWVSYFILALLIGSTVMWWLQSSNMLTEAINANSGSASKVNPESGSENKPALSLTEGGIGGINSVDGTAQQSEQNDVEAVLTNELSEAESVKPDESLHSLGLDTASVALSQPDKTVEDDVAKNKDVGNKDPNAPATIIFTFAGDCWVNIYDGTGERLAWGIKKSGYVMTISGQAPWNVTLGKPELVSINYAGQAIDMSQFNIGNIAKFTLPIKP
ncbi:MAG: DUF4115 domain-containing protein [Alteromonadaceae bacterium]|nr:DUF4115 domain-containing protein [Alteromonadaceae bacterium]